MTKKEECCYIDDLEKHLSEINDKKMDKYEKPIVLKDWSTHISGKTNFNVKKHWIDYMRKNPPECINRTSAMSLFSAINQLREQYGLPKIPNSNLICKVD